MVKEFLIILMIATFVLLLSYIIALVIKDKLDDKKRKRIKKELGKR